MSAKPKRFAYGSDTVNDCTCPAVTAGYSPASGDETTMIAERYDWHLRNEYNVENRHGTVDDDLASEAWMDMVRHYRSRGMDYYADLGEEIAETIGWQ